MATPDPYRDPRPADPRYEQPPVVVERRSSAGLWAFAIILILLIVAAILYFAGVFNGRPLVTETDKTNIHVVAPSGGTGGGATGGGH